MVRRSSGVSNVVYKLAKKFPTTYGNLKVCALLKKQRRLKNINPVNAVKSHFSTTYLNVILPSMPKAS
jgi:hypothetical protein